MLFSIQNIPANQNPSPKKYPIMKESFDPFRFRMTNSTKRIMWAKAQKLKGSKAKIKRVPRKKENTVFKII